MNHKELNTNINIFNFADSSLLPFTPTEAG